MPYINRERRIDLCYSHVVPDNPGELNYLLTKVCVEYAKSKTSDEYPVVSYSTLNAIVGALECAKLEFYRRAVAPYENTKIKENGDVY